MPFIAKRAVILAAGRGLRLRPLTDQTPKPLLLFNGAPIIENIIASVQRAGINDIVVVTGYMHERFSYLPGKFDGVRLVFNSRWGEGNNVLSAFACIEAMSDAVVINGDAIITGDILRTEYLGTTMFADRARGLSREWELLLDGRGLVSAINTAGGADILQHREITFIASCDFPLFKQRVTRAVAEGRVDGFFEFCLFPGLAVHVLKLPRDAVFDIDGYDE